MSLIDLNGDLGRIDGGFGMGLDNPQFKINFSDEVVGIDINASKEQKDLILDVKAKLETEHHILLPNLQISIESSIPSHIGLGSKTQFLLLIARGLTELAKIKIDIHRITQIVHRGGTSGVGYRVFETGGFILDGGHSYGDQQEKDSFLPSSSSTAPPALLISRFLIPKEWRIVLTMLNVKQGANQAEEKNIFQKYCPIPHTDVEKITHRVLMQILPGILTEDLILLGKGINSINKLGFKAIEISLQHPYVQYLIDYVYQHYHYPVGMSSFGPTIFSIVGSQAQAEHLQAAIMEKIKQDQESPGGSSIICSPNNKGYQLNFR
jgi:beta-ribofuranosylaminobenzene 5'-phosphate synthase